LGREAAWWPRGAPERREKIATAENLQQLSSDLIALGSHTLSHPRLSEVSTAEAKREIFESKAKLEMLLRRAVKSFSFPYGDFTADLVTLCRNAGYVRVFTSTPHLAFQQSGEFVVGRIAVEPVDWKLEFHLKLVGAYRWLPYASRMKQIIVGGNSFSRMRSGDARVMHSKSNE
jgi:peptidoglycan/xylan/chitin deacetylase (PgdA/CDA1 family)